MTEIPYQVQKSRLIERLAEMLQAKRLPVLADIRDESAEDIRIVLEPKSKTQISVPVEIFAPGQTSITAQFVNEQGRALSDPVELSLNLTVIDSRVAWFTTGAAVLLFLAAITQSVRRVRRARK